MGVQENKAPGTSAQVLIGLILVVAGTAAVAVLTYGLTGAGELSTSVSLGGSLFTCWFGPWHFGGLGEATATPAFER